MCTLCVGVKGIYEDRAHTLMCGGYRIRATSIIIIIVNIQVFVCANDMLPRILCVLAA